VQVADENGVLETVASCGEDTRYIELFAERSDDGPGADSYRKATVVSAVDLDPEASQWPAPPRHAPLGSARSTAYR
jgi:hypothetical protein